MTKLRAPLSFELALTKVAGLIGWKTVSGIVGQAERTVRNWSDPDAAAGIRFDAGEKLDLAYQAAGGGGAPFLECYALRLKSAASNTFGSAEAIALSSATAAKETGEAIAAAIAAARPDACHRVYEDAEREIEEGIGALNDALSQVRRRRASEAGLHGEPAL